MTSLKRSARQIQITGNPTDITGRFGKKSDIFYKFKLGRSSDIYLTLNSSTAKANVDLYLLNQKNRVLSKSTKPGNASESIATTLKQGNYLIQVRNKRSKPKTSYQLKVATTGPMSTPDPALTPISSADAQSLTVPRGQTVTLKGNQLRTTKLQAGDQLRYVITQMPRNGFLQLDGKPLTAGQSFSQADIDQGRISYRSARAGVTVIGKGSNPLVSGFNIAWQGPGGSDGGADNEIFFFDGTTTRQLTQNTVDDKVQGISGAHVAWASQLGAANAQGATYELFHFNGVAANRLTNNAVNEDFVGMDGSNLFWTSPVGPANQYGYSTYEVFYAKDGAVRQLTNNSVDEVVSDFEAGTAVWEAATGAVGASGRVTSEVFYFNGSGVQQLTNNNVDDLAPRLDNGKVAWSARSGVSELGAPSTEVMLFDGASIRQLTFNNTDDFIGDIKGNLVVWMSRSGPMNSMGMKTYEVFRYDGATTQRLTNNAVDESLVDISGSNLLWMGGGPADASGRGTTELFLNNGTQTIQLTRNQADDVPVGLLGSRAVWSSKTGAGNSREVFYFDGTGVKQLTNDARDDNEPSFSETTISWSATDGGTSQILSYDLGDQFGFKVTDRGNQAAGEQIMKINFV
jgi:hypothetical protein